MILIIPIEFYDAIICDVILVMDTITHLALGAVTGEILLGKKLGKKAMLLGAIANNIPDIDFLAAFWLSPADNVLAHRGFTHSILCSILLAFLLAYGLARWFKKDNLSYTQWSYFLLIQLGLHLFVDAFNAYGVGWFIPFDASRISFNAVFVLDPFYSTILLIVSFTLAILSIAYLHRLRFAIIGLTLSFLYLGYSLFNKYRVDKEASQLLANQGIGYTNYFSTPTPFNTWLWFVVAEADSGYNIGYRSVFDHSQSMEIAFIPRNENLLEGWERDHTVHQLKKFSQGYYTVEYRSDTLIFNDLRFGQITGWKDLQAPFSFHYYLNYPKENLMVMQRGRVANWNRESLQSMFNRIKGD
jgi:inner membrane protein